MLKIEYTLKDRSGIYTTKIRTFANMKHFENFVNLTESQGKKLIGSKKIKS